MPEVNFADLKTISSTLTYAADTIVRTGNGMPAFADGGAGAPALTAIMTHLIENAARVCDGLDVCAHGVDESSADYQSTDQKSASALRGLVDPRLGPR